MKLPFFLFPFLFPNPSHKVCCPSQLAVNRGTGNTRDTRLSKKSKVEAHLTAPRAGSSPSPQAVNGRGGGGLDHAAKLWAQRWTLLLGDLLPRQRSIPWVRIQPSTGDFCRQLAPAFWTSHGNPYQARPLHITREGVSPHAGKVTDYL